MDTLACRIAMISHLTPSTFPGGLRNNRTVTLGSLLVPYPQYTSITQTNTDGKQERTHMLEVRAQRPFAKGLSFLAAYAWSHDRVQQWFDDLAQYRVLNSNGADGWEWRPPSDNPLPVHRITGALTWQLPIGRERALLSNIPAGPDYAIGGWQYTNALRWYSGRPLFFATYAVDGNPIVSNPTTISGSTPACSTCRIRSHRAPIRSSTMA